MQRPLGPCTLLFGFSCGAASAQTRRVVAALLALACALPHHVPWAPVHRALRGWHSRLVSEFYADMSLGRGECSVCGWWLALVRVRRFPCARLTPYRHS